MATPRTPVLRAALVATVFMMVSGDAGAAEPRFGPNDVQTLFFIAKSDDHNRVDYGMRLDSACRPVGREPVFPYWREFEPPPPVRTKPMSSFSKIGYGIATQKLLEKTPTGAESAIVLRKVARAIYITTKVGTDGRCTALVRTRVRSTEYAELLSIFVKLSGPLSVDWVDIKGKDLATGREVTERLRE